MPDFEAAKTNLISTFATATVHLLMFWPAMRIAIEQDLGDEAGRTALAEDIVSEFLDMSQMDSRTSFEEPINIPEEHDIVDTIKYCIEQYFDIDIEDDSEKDIARDVRLLWKESLFRATHDGPYPDGLIGQVAEAAKKLKNETGFAQVQHEHNDDDSSSDDEEDSSDDESAMQVDEVPQLSKQEPQIDDDGFETVTRKGRHHA